jgi:chemotaxis protein histidine kinase CheA
MLNDEDRRTLLGIYGASALEVAAGMRVMLGAWQTASARGQAIAGLLERAHRLRGDSSTVELHSTVELLRAFEALLKKMRSGELAPTPEHGALLTAVVDQLAEVAGTALDGEGEDPDAHKELIERLGRAVRVR